MNMIYSFRFSLGPVVKWYNGAFALRKRGFDSPQVHKDETACPAAGRLVFVDRRSHVFATAKTGEPGSWNFMRDGA